MPLPPSLCLDTRDTLPYIFVCRRVMIKSGEGKTRRSFACKRKYTPLPDDRLQPDSPWSLLSPFRHCRPCHASSSLCCVFLCPRLRKFFMCSLQGRVFVHRVLCAFENSERESVCERWSKQRRQEQTHSSNLTVAWFN